jgi:hypothetical protein
MILDALTKLAAAQQITADVVFTNTYDTGNITPKRNVAVGEPLAILVVITAIGTNTGSAVLQAVDSAASAGTTQKIRGAIELATADIAVGGTFIIPYSHGVAPLRYKTGYADITGTVDFTIDAYIGALKDITAAADNYARGFSFDIS